MAIVSKKEIDFFDNPEYFITTDHPICHFGHYNQPPQLFATLCSLSSTGL